MPSLRKSILFLIQSQGEASLTELHQMAQSMGRKQSNCERLLRKLSEEGFIEPIKNEKKYVTGYINKPEGLNKQNKLV